MKYKLALVGLLLISTFSIVVWAQPKKGCNELYSGDKAVTVNSQQLNAEVAVTPQAQDKGLGDRKCIGSDQAMLFVFDHPDNYAFWMKAMKFPIDIVWLSSNHKVVKIEKDLQPSTYPQRFINKDLAQYVLEVQANRSSSLKVSIGTLVSF